MTGYPVTVSVGRGCGVSLYSSARCCSLGPRVCACLHAPCFVHGADHLSDAPCPVACCRFVAVCFVCRLLCGCAIRERSRADCDMVHASLCGCAFDGGRGCRLLFTV